MNNTDLSQSMAALAQLRALAASHSITNKALAEKMGITPQTVGQMFSGKFSPTLTTVYKVLAAINDLAGQAYTLADIETLKP